MSRKRNNPVPFKEEEFDVNDLTDSEDEYTEAEKNLLLKARTKQVEENYDSEDEVYGLHDDDSESEKDSMKSDIEEQEDDDIPNQKAWGQKKKAYYHTDYVDPDYSSVNRKDLEKAELEEQEARKIQKRLADRLDDADYGVEFINEQINQGIEHEDEENIKVDISKLTKEQKRELFLRENPEFLGLVKDYKECFIEIRDVITPYLTLLKKHKCADTKVTIAIKTRERAYLNYCLNISFYLLLKARRIPSRSHPVMKRLAQFKRIINTIKTETDDIIEHVKVILEGYKQNLPITIVKEDTNEKYVHLRPQSSKNKKTSKLASKEMESSGENESMDVDSEEDDSTRKQRKKLINEKKSKSKNEKITKIKQKKFKPDYFPKVCEEFPHILDDYEECMAEITDVLEPYANLLERYDCLMNSASFAFKVRLDAFKEYCENITLYFQAKEEDSQSIDLHAVRRKLNGYKRLINTLKLKTDQYMDQIKEILAADQQNLPIRFITEDIELPKPKESKKHLTKKQLDLNSEDMEVDDYDDDDDDDDDDADADAHADTDADDDVDLDLDEENEDDDKKKETEKTLERRPIDYKIAKNKGITPYRKKAVRNARVNYKNKYRKALIRRKGAVREVRKELTRYSGEISGINPYVKKSRKLN